MANLEIRNAASKERVRLWQIADALNMSDVAFSKLLRHELLASKKLEIISIIERLARQKEDP